VEAERERDVVAVEVLERLVLLIFGISGHES
jgi:hypothetical protein